MALYSLSEAREIFSALVERALKGERVVITRYGQPVVELKVVDSAGLAALVRAPDAA